MDADWNVACGAEDPWMVVPWNTADYSLQFIDLRHSPGRLRDVPESAEYPEIGVSLRHWNRQGSPLFTTKCDVWEYGADLFDADDLAGFPFACGSYIDLIFRDPQRFASFIDGEEQLIHWTVATRLLEFPDGRCEWVLRRARVATYLLEPAGSTEEFQDGFGCTSYVWGYGKSPAEAAAVWARVLRAVTHCCAV